MPLLKTSIPRRIRPRQRVVEDVAVGVEPLAVAVALDKGVDAQETAEVGVVDPALLGLGPPYPLGRSLWLSKLNPVDLPTKAVY